jgi:hypothetical protein
MFIATLFAIPHLCPTTDERIKKMCDIYIYTHTHTHNRVIFSHKENETM